MPVFTFDPIKHEYRKDGKLIYSVTQILKRAGLYSYGHVNQIALQNAAHFGKVVHAACALDDVDDLGECDPLVMERVNGWRKFKKHFCPTFRLIEQRLWSTRYNFAGTPDRSFLMKINGRLILPDIKTGQKEHWHAYQTSGYKILYEENFPGERVRERWGIYLIPNDYKPVEYTSFMDETIFMSALIISNAKKHHEEDPIDD